MSANKITTSIHSHPALVIFFSDSVEPPGHNAMILFIYQAPESQIQVLALSICPATFSRLYLYKVFQASTSLVQAGTTQIAQNQGLSRLPKKQRARCDAQMHQSEVVPKVSCNFLMDTSSTAILLLDEIVMGERTSCTGWKELILRAWPVAA